MIIAICNQGCNQKAIHHCDVRLPIYIVYSVSPTSAAKRQAHWSKIPVACGVAFQSSALAHCSTLLSC